MSIYFDDKGNMRVELLGKESENLARKFVIKKPDGKVDKGRSISASQLRRFYGDLKNLEQKLAFKQQSWDEAEAFNSILPLVKMVKSKAAYAANPRSQKIPAAFKKWLDENIDAINTAEDFKAFMLHFEAVVGFCYGLGMSNS